MGVIARVEFAVLGPVTASLDGTLLPSGTRKEQLLLALLLVHVNQTVTVDQMVEALWGDEAPAKPATSIRAYVSNIRRSLTVGEDDPKSLLVTEPGGYRLAVDRSRVDACRFEDAVSDIISGDIDLGAVDQAARLDVALAEVTGEPFADFVYEDFARVETARLTELVLAARELRCELAIRLGDAATWLPTIGALAAVHPLRERLRAAHMRALVETGRHGEALRVFAEHRSRLIEEMGIEPGPDLRALEQEILALDDIEVSRSASSEPDANAPGTDSAAVLVDEHATAPAERRQLTTIAVLRRATGGGSADPEDVGEAVATARSRWRAIVEAHGAAIEEIPDGVLAHLGYPIARERDVERAVRAALSIVADDPHCGVGVATSVVLVTPKRDGATFSGDAPTVAMQLAFAAPDGSVVVAERTRELAADHIRFEVEDGLITAVGITIPSAVTSMADLVGRVEELALGRRTIAETRDGTGRALVVTGDAGMGKTAFVDRLAADFGERALRFLGSPFHADTALWPVVVALEDHPELSVPDVLREWARLGDEALTELAPDPVERRSILLDAALDVVLGSASKGPTLCVFDDVHCMDASSLELIEALIEAAPTTSLMVVVAIRGSDTLGLGEQGHASVVGLGPMALAPARALVRELAGEWISADTEEAILERAGGVPLFIEELTLSLAESQAAVGEAEPTPGIPETLHDLLTARLDAVPRARTTLHLAAVAGEAFTADLLATVGGEDPARVSGDLASLCDAGILVRDRRRGGVRYRFRHGLILETAYEAVPRRRRAELHGRIATALLEQDPALGDTAAEVLARHHEAAGALPEALRSWLGATRRNLSVSALPEASEAIRQGLAVADRLDDELREALIETIVDLWLARGVVLTQQSGPASQGAMRVYEHLLTELESSLNASQRFRALWGRWYAMSTGWNAAEALVAAAEVHRAAEESGDTALLIEGHHVMWASLLTAGEFDRALVHTRAARSLYEQVAHHWLTYEFGGHDPGVCMHSTAGLASWILDDQEVAREELAAAIRLGDDIGHAYSRLEASFGPVAVAVLDGDAGVLRSEADALENLIDIGALPFDSARGYVDGCRGVAAVVEGAEAEGLATLERAAGTWADLWGAYCLPFDTELAAALDMQGRPAEARSHIDAILERGSRGNWWDSELHRVRGEVMSHEGELKAAEAELRQAIRVARSQGAACFERRAESSLATVTEQGTG